MPNQVNIEIVEPKLFSGVVADELIASISDAIADHGKCSLVLSGGKTPGEIYRTMALPPRVEEVDWSKLILYWGDERFVPEHDVQSNYQTVKETLLARLPENGPTVHPINTALKSAAAAAEAYEKTIRASEKIGAQDYPVFDLVMLGVGEDGHIASIFPGSPMIKKPLGKLCSSATAPDGEIERISLTPEAIFAAKKILIIVRGENKADIVEKVLSGSESELDLPAKLYKRGGSRVTWFLDSSAAKKASAIKL